MDSVVKKSLAAPIRQFTCCVSRAKDSDGWVGRNTKGLEGGKGKSAASKPTKAVADPALVRSYLADLEKERKRRAARNAQKNAERAARRAHFRRKHQLSKDERHSIFDTFQGLNLNLGMVTGNAQSKTSANAGQCRVM